MSTTLQQPGSGYVDSHDFISLKLAKTSATIKTTEVLTSLMGVVALVVGYLFLFVLADHWLVPQGIGFVPRLFLLGGLLATTGVWLAFKVIIPYVKNVHALYAAKMLETSEPEFRGNLLNLVDLQRSGRKISPHIMSALEKRAAIRLADLNVEQAIDNRLMLRMSYALLGLVVLTCLYTVFSPKPIMPSLWAALVPTRDRQVATRTEISAVKPGDAEILARSQFEVTADILGELPEKVTLNYTTADRRHVDEPIRMYPVEEGLRSYRGIVTGENGKGILQNFTYTIAAGDAQSPEFTVTVKQPPSANVDSVRLKYPRYMELDAKTQSGGHIDAWEGTTVTVRATANKPVKSAVLMFIDDENSAAKAEEIAMDIADGTQLSLEWTLSIRSDGTTPKFFRIQCRDAENNVDPAPTLYSLNIRPDLPPEVTLHDPTQDLQLPANAAVPLAVTAQDPDFMLRYVILRVEKEGEPIWEEPLMEGQPRQDFQGFHDFKLAPLNLQPGEVISFWIEAHDNKEPVANRRSTPKLNIAIEEPVSEEEAEKLLEEQKQEQQDKLEQQSDEPQPEAGQESGEPQQTDNGEGAAEQQDPSQEGEPQPQGEQQEGAEGQPQESGAEGEQQGEPQPGEQPGEKPSADDPQQKQEGESQQSEPGRRDSSEGLKSDGTDDDEALRRLLEKQEQDQPGADEQKQDAQAEEQPQDGEQDQEKSDSPSAEEMKSDENKGAGEQGEEKNDEDAGGEQQKNAGDEGNAGEMPEENPQEKGESNSGDKSKSDANDKQDAQEGPADGEQEKVTNPLKKPTKSKEGEVKDGEVTEEDDPNADPGDKTTPKRPDLKDEKPSQPSDDMPDPEGAPERESADEKDRREPTKVKREQPPKSDMPPGEGMEQGDESDDSQKGDSQNSKSKDQNGKSSDSSESSDGDPAGDAKDQGDEAGKPSDSNSDDKKQEMKDDAEQQDGKQQKKEDEQKDAEQQQEGGKEGGEQKQDEGGGGAKGKGQGKGSPSGEPSEQPSQEGNKSGKRGATSSGGNTGGDASQTGSNDGANGEGESPYELENAEAANLEDKEKAVNLVLKEIEDQLKRGELDPELLKEMGWTEGEMKKFVERMQRQLQAPDAENATPADRAKRLQFEEMLKNIDTTGQARERTGVDVKKSAGQEIGPRRLDVPPEFRDAYEAYTKSLSKYKNQPAEKE